MHCVVSSQEALHAKNQSIAEALEERKEAEIEDVALSLLKGEEVEDHDIDDVVFEVFDNEKFFDIARKIGMAQTAKEALAAVSEYQNIFIGAAEEVAKKIIEEK